MSAETEDGLLVQVAELIDQEIKKQSKFTQQEKLSFASAQNLIALESNLMYHGSRDSLQSAKVHAIRIAAYACRVAQELCEMEVEA